MIAPNSKKTGVVGRTPLVYDQELLQALSACNNEGEGSSLPQLK